MLDVLTADDRVCEGDPALWEKLDRNRVRCYACGHCCPIPEGQPGVCKVRFNHGGTLYVPWGYVAGAQCDPIEKKPFFHAHPGALAYSFGMLGCDLHCSYCQNWVTSQALRDPDAVSPPIEADPELLIKDALAQGAKVVVSTYNERVGGCGFPPGPAGGLADRVCFQWQRDAAGARVSPSLDRSLQGGSQELRRSPLSRTRRTPAAHPRHHPQFAPNGCVAGDRHLTHSWVQRQRRRTAEYDRIFGRRFARHTLARDRFSSGLQNDFTRRYASRRFAARRCHRP